MKRILTIAAVAAFAVFTLASCEKDNSEKKPQFDYATVTAKYYINDDLAKAADITLNITKFDGTTETKTVSTTQQTVDIETYKGRIPADFTFSFAATQKDNLTKDSYDCALTYEIAVKVYDSKGTLKKSKSSSDTMKIGDKKNNIDLIVARYNRVGGKITIKDDMSIETSAL